MPGVEAVVAATRHTFARHTHDQYGIGVIVDGAQASASGRGPVEAVAGDVITVNPDEVHDGAPIGDSGRSWRMLYLAPALVADLCADVSDGRITQGEFSNPVLTDPRLAARFHRLFSLMIRGDDGLGEEELLRLVGATLGTCSTTADPSIPQAIARARSRIDDDPAGTLTLSDLAREADLSRFQLLRGFAKATGLTPHAYLVQRRLHLARRLIAGGLSLAEAAIASGFADQSHMTRAFRQSYGLSPGTYAEAAR
jgi:AraC-type DNA-binding domain-containing proteins